MTEKEESSFTGPTAKEQGGIPAWPSQKGLTTTRMTMPIISKVGISFIIRQWRDYVVLRSCANMRTERET